MGRLPAVIAHRGACGEAPENTRSGIRRSVAQGADYVEMDVQRSADGVLVLMHDRSITETTNVQTVFPGRPSYMVSDFSLDELSQLDAGAWFGAGFVGEDVLTLQEALAELGERTGALVEVKHPRQYPGIAADVASALDEAENRQPMMSDRLVVVSIDDTWVGEFHSVCPARRVGVVAFRPSQRADRDLRAVAEFASVLGTGERSLSESFVERAHSLGIRDVYLAADQAEDQERAVRVGEVDGIVTNFPRTLRGILDGTEWVVTAESMRDPHVEGSAWIVSERARNLRNGACTQLVVAGAREGDRARMRFFVPSGGLYAVSAVFGQGPGHGAHSLAIDGRYLGGDFDGYSRYVGAATRDYGVQWLAEGSHDLTLTVRFKNPAASGVAVALKRVSLRPVDRGSAWATWRPCAGTC